MNNSEDYLNGYSDGYNYGRTSWTDLSVPSFWIGGGVGLCAALIVFAILGHR